MTTMNENMSWTKLTHLFFKKSLNPGAPFCISTFILTFLIAFLNICTREKQYPSLIYIAYANASNNTLMTVNSYVV